MPIKRRGEEETTTALLAWPEPVDTITSRQVPLSFYVYAGRSCIKENGAQTNRAIGNGDWRAESFDASRFSLLTVAWTNDGIAALRPRSGDSGLPLATLLPLQFPSSSWFSPFCPIRSFCL
jgi:hypothetical protein